PGALDRRAARGRAAPLAQRLALGEEGALGVAGPHAEGLGLESPMAETVLIVGMVVLVIGGVVFFLYLQKSLEEKHRQMLADLHGGLTKQGDRLGGHLNEL